MSKKRIKVLLVDDDEVFAKVVSRHARKKT